MPTQCNCGVAQACAQSDISALDTCVAEHGWQEAAAFCSLCALWWNTQSEDLRGRLQRTFNAAKASVEKVTPILPDWKPVVKRFEEAAIACYLEM